MHRHESFAAFKSKSHITLETPPMVEVPLRFVPRLAVVLVLLTGCAASKPTLRSMRDDALDRRDSATVYAYDQAILGNAYLSFSEMLDLYTVLPEHFERFARDDLAPFWPLTGENAERALGRSRSLIALGEGSGATSSRVLAPVVDGYIRDHEFQAVGAMWLKVEALEKERAWVRAAVLGHSILHGLQDRTAFDPKLARVFSEAAEHHLLLAKDRRQSLPGGRALHGRIAHVFGAQLPADLVKDDEKVTAESRIDWKLTEAGPCEAIAKDAGSHLSASPGGPEARVQITIDSCPMRVDQWTTQESGTYTYRAKELVTRQVPVKNNVCTTHNSYVGSYDTTSGVGSSDTLTVTTTHLSVPTERCSYEYTNASVSEEVEVEKVASEQYQVQHSVGRGSAQGQIRYAFAGREETRPFSFPVETRDYTDFTRAHGPSESSKPGDVTSDMRSRLVGMVQADLQTIAKEVASTMSRDLVAKAQSASDPAEVEDAYMRASLMIDEPHPGFVRWLEKEHQVPPAAAVAAIGRKALEPIDFATLAPVTMPTVPGELIQDAKRDFMKDSLTNSTGRATRMLTITAGPSLGTTTRNPGGRLYGLAGSIIGNAQLKGNRPIAVGFMGRLGVGIDQSKTQFTDFDLSLLVGPQLGRLSLTPFVGVGLDYMSTAASEPAPEQIVLPLAVFAQTGGRISYAFDLLPVTVDLAYSKAFRSTSSGVTESKRADLRTVFIFGEGSNFALTARYTEYLDVRDAFFKAFGPEGRVAQTFWVLGGLGW
jgi:hypothetical protein